VRLIWFHSDAATSENVNFAVAPPPAGNWLMQMVVFRAAFSAIAGGWNYNFGTTDREKVTLPYGN